MFSSITLGLDYYDTIDVPWIGIFSIYLAAANLITNPVVYLLVCPRYRDMLVCRSASLPKLTSVADATVITTRPRTLSATAGMIRFQSAASAVKEVKKRSVSVVTPYGGSGVAVVRAAEY